ncbi:MAG: Bifunctional protein GlmU [Steroidobacteraceae bacterium]|nr:Bifunctional protein GlmU [Steroidobacteraceae bacterium]
MESQETPTLHAVVLAAGASTRFGSPKQLVRIDGRPLLHSVVSRAVEVAGHSVTVVLGAHAGELTALLRHSPASVLVNRDWQEGIASSIRAGMGQVPGTADGVLLVLADQPAVTTEDLRRLAGAWRRQPDSILAAQYSGIVGVPAIFPRWAFRDLAELRGDRGAQQLLLRHVDRVARLRMPSAALDIDRPEDLLAVETTATSKPV